MNKEHNRFDETYLADDLNHVNFNDTCVYLRPTALCRSSIAYRLALFFVVVRDGVHAESGDGKTYHTLRPASLALARSSASSAL